jgi:hypothetical protein
VLEILSDSDQDRIIRAIDEMVSRPWSELPIGRTQLI